MDKAGIIAQIIKAEGLKGPDAEARKRSLDNKDLNELEQMLNSALSNSKTYAKPTKLTVPKAILVSLVITIGLT